MCRNVWDELKTLYSLCTLYALLREVEIVNWKETFQNIMLMITITYKMCELNIRIYRKNYKLMNTCALYLHTQQLFTNSLSLIFRYVLYSYIY